MSPAAAEPAADAVPAPTGACGWGATGGTAGLASPPALPSEAVTGGMTVDRKPKAKPEPGEEGATPVAVPVGSASRVLVGPAGSDANRAVGIALAIPAVVAIVVTMIPGRAWRSGKSDWVAETAGVPGAGWLLLGGPGCVDSLGAPGTSGALGALGGLAVGVPGV